MKHALVVDDKEDNLYYLTALLTGHGWIVESAHHGADLGSPHLSLRSRGAHEARARRRRQGGQPLLSDGASHGARLDRGIRPPRRRSRIAAFEPPLEGGA